MRVLPESESELVHAKRRLDWHVQIDWHGESVACSSRLDRSGRLERSILPASCLDCVLPASCLVSHTMILVVISRASIRCFQDGRISSKDADEETSPPLLRPRLLTADDQTSPYWLCWRLEDAEEQTTGQPTAHSPHQTLSPQHTD